MTDIEERNRFLTQTYGWMFFSVLISFISSAIFSQTSFVQNMASSSTSAVEIFLIAIVLFGIEIFMIHQIYKEAATNTSFAGFLLLLFSAFDGATFATVFAFYSSEAITITFLATAGVFGAMSLTGMLIKKNLSFMYKQLIGVLIALIVISFIEIFLATPLTVLLTSIIGSGLFALLTMVDTNSIYREAKSGNASTGLAIVGALELYLDFINLFINLLEIIGPLFGGGSNNN